jgi:hypothetical protein
MKVDFDDNPLQSITSFSFKYFYNHCQSFVFSYTCNLRLLLAYCSFLFQVCALIFLTYIKFSIHLSLPTPPSTSNVHISGYAQDWTSKVAPVASPSKSTLKSKIKVFGESILEPTETFSEKAPAASASGGTTPFLSQHQRHMGGL